MLPSIPIDVTNRRARSLSTKKIKKPVEGSISVLVGVAAPRHHPHRAVGEPMNTDQVSIVPSSAAESVCGARLAVQQLISEVRAAFAEMDELLERAERLISSSRHRSHQTTVVIGGALAAPTMQGPLCR